MKKLLKFLTTVIVMGIMVGMVFAYVKTDKFLDSLDFILPLADKMHLTRWSSNISTGMVACKSLKVNCSGACNIKTTADAEGDATLTFSGASNGTISFTGNTFKLASSGAGKLNLHVDCLQLIASNSGAAKVSISGTADKTTIKATGVSKINTAELNKL